MNAYPYILHTPSTPRAVDGRVLKALGFFAIHSAAYGAMRHFGAYFPDLIVSMDVPSTAAQSAPIVGRLHQTEGIEKDPINPEITWYIREEGKWEWRKELPPSQLPLPSSPDEVLRQSESE